MSRLLRFVALIAIVISTLARTASLTSATGFSNTTGGLAAPPDLQKPQSSNPNGLSGVKPADPGSNVHLMAPPSPNTNGTASLSYPITLPAGRQGMQPDVSLTYDSSNKDGWLGQGWALSVPSITVDTRWGVPHYDSTNESESYLLNGDEMTPVARTSPAIPRSGSTKTFHRRIEGTFEQITRHGTGPDNYWWQIVSKDGTTSYYGDIAGTGGVDTLRVSTGPSDSTGLTSGHIFQWVLRKTVDVNGNTITYNYQHAHDAAGTYNDALHGDQIYLRSINYAGVNGLPGPYNVTFNRSLGSPARKDIQVDGRGGFLTVTAQLLSGIDVSYTDAQNAVHPIRSYALSYSEGVFKKQLLQSITETGANGSAFNTHTFHYYNDILNNDGSYKGFGSAQRWNSHNDGIQQSAIPIFGPASALSGAVSHTYSGHIYIGFAPLDPQKEGSAGGKLGVAYSDTETNLTLLDINSDSLPDKVYKKNGHIYFRLNESGASPASSCPETQTSGTLYDCFGPETQISTLDSHEISKEQSVTIDGGAEAYFVATAIVNIAATFTFGNVYFTDVNADGLPDLVDNGTVYFNSLDPTTNNPVFTKDTGNVVADTTAIQTQYEQQVQKQMKTYPLADTLRRWTAPYDGHIAITGNVTLTGQSTDGVRVAIQQNGSELWTTTLNSGTPGPVTPPSGSVGNISVSAGDHIYFRSGSINDGQNDQVDWNPDIKYVDSTPAPLTKTDVNGLNAYAYNASNDFVLAGRPGVGIRMPVGGTVDVSGTLHKSAATSDDVTVLLIKTPSSGSPTVVSTQTLAWNSTGDISLSQTGLTVTKTDTLSVRVQVDSPIDLSKLSWTTQPTIVYKTSTDPKFPVVDANNQPILTITAPYDIDLYPRTVLSSGQTANSPESSWTATKDGDLTVVSPSVTAGIHTHGLVVFTVKKLNTLLGKETASVATDTVGASVTESTMTIKNVKKGDVLYFDFSLYDPSSADQQDLSAPVVTVKYGSDAAISVPSAIHLQYNQVGDELGKGLYAEPYRGWAYAGYNANSGSDESTAIHENKLVLDTSQYSGSSSNTDPANNGLMKSSAWMYSPDPANNIWRGPSPGQSKDNPKGLLWVGPGSMSSSRLGSANFPSPGSLFTTGARAVPRLSVATQLGLSLGVDFGVGGVDTSVAVGATLGLVDYLDMNGDGFPDIVSGSSSTIQYTDPFGHYGSSLSIPEINAAVRSGNSAVWNVGVNGMVPLIKANEKGKSVAPQAAEPASKTANAGGTGGAQDGAGAAHKAASTEAADAAPKENKEGGEGVQLGFGGSLEHGTSNDPASLAGLNPTQFVPITDLVDLNGDGLPDRVYVDNSHNMQVAFNLGYGFSPKETWGVADLDKGSSYTGTLGPNIGFNTGDYAYAGGVSLSGEEDISKATLVDMNGDGLPDRVTRDGGELMVGINTGNAFVSDVVWHGALWNNQSVLSNLTSNGVARSLSVGLGGGAYVTIPIGPLCIAACYIILNPGFDYAQSMSRQDAMITDMNGDGYADYVTANDLLQPNDGEMEVAPNLTGRTNLLQSVTRPLGSSFSIEYKREGDTINQSYPRWGMSKVVLNDGHSGDGVDTQTTTYQYANNVYSTSERDFLGFQTVTSNRLDAGGQVYRSTVDTYYNDNYYDRGLLKSEVVQDASTNKFTETVNHYVLRDVMTSTESADLDTVVATPGLFPQITDPTGTLFPELVKTDQNSYEGQASAGKTTNVTYAYDQYGNVTQIVDAGDPGAADDVTAVMTYKDCSSSTYVMGAPTEITVTGNGGTVLRHRQADVSCATGKPTEIREFDTTTGHVSTTDMVYDSLGNLTSATQPANLNNQRYALTYTYDSALQTYVTSVTDSFGYTSGSTYEPLFGHVTSTTDINNNRTDYTYDEFGRLTSVTGPDEQGTANKTITMTYHDATVSTPAWAETKLLDVARGVGNPMDNVVFVDGLDRVIQTKKSVTVFTGVTTPAQDVMLVSGKINYDFAQRVVDKYYPMTEPLGTPGTFNTGHDSVNPTHTTYDVLNRPLTTTFPDGTTDTLSYDFGSDHSGTTQFRTTETDAKGHQTITFDNTRHLTTSIERFLSPSGTSSPTWTDYGYDPLGALTQLKDDKGNTTTVTYDTLGRQTSVDNPDGGKVDTLYDPAGNMTGKITATLRAEGKQISYNYDYNRLKSVSYPDNPSNNVTYTYGGPGAANNSAGRITQVADGTGSRQDFYGKIGELTKEIRSITGHTGTSTTQYQYDTWDRLQNVTYPDGEVVSYNYDSGGLIRQGTGVKLGNTYNYVKRYEYDKFGHPVYMETGNGIRTRYTYAPDTLRLQTVKAGPATGAQLQNLSYTYDALGNVLTATNSIPVPSATQFGGPTTQTYQYDSLNRLTNATGTYQFGPGKTRTYNLSMTYDSINRILTKQQTDQIKLGTAQPVTQNDTTYNWSYVYGATHPDAPIHIGTRTYSYDANGNQTGWVDDITHVTRTTTWNENNQVQHMVDSGHVLDFRYDDTGQRVIKKAPLGETDYVNQYYTLQSGAVAIKQIFLGGMRVESQLVKPPTSSNPNPVETDVSYYQGDHQGSSNYITSGTGANLNHIEYFPFGETWVAPTVGTRNTPYLYTGQEQDAETGLYYENARYYDGRTSVWQSVDPLLMSNPALALTDPSFLNAYSYVDNNPVNYTDPTGEGKRKYDTTQYGGRKNEQGRLTAKFSRTVNGSSFESEHVVGFEPLARTSDLTRGDAGRSSALENKAPAYYETYGAHRAHIGTGTSGTADGSGFTSEAYRATQRSLIEAGDVSSAVQINQLGYAFSPTFRAQVGTVEGNIANDSFKAMAAGMQELTYAQGGSDLTVSVNRRQQGEMILSRYAAETGTWPSAEMFTAMNDWVDQGS